MTRRPSEDKQTGMATNSWKHIDKIVLNSQGNLEPIDEEEFDHGTTTLFIYSNWAKSEGSSKSQNLYYGEI